MSIFCWYEIGKLVVCYVRQSEEGNVLHVVFIMWKICCKVIFNELRNVLPILGVFSSFKAQMRQDRRKLKCS